MQTCLPCTVAIIIISSSSSWLKPVISCCARCCCFGKYASRRSRRAFFFTDVHWRLSTMATRPPPPVANCTETQESSSHGLKAGDVVKACHGNIQVCCGACGERTGSLSNWCRRPCKFSDTCKGAKALFCVQTRKPHKPRTVPAKFAHLPSGHTSCYIKCCTVMRKYVWSRRKCGCTTAALADRADLSSEQIAALDIENNEHH